MNTISKIVMLIVTFGVLSWIAFGFFGIQALFIDNEVQEEIPEFISEVESRSDTPTSAGEKADLKNILLGKGSFQQGDSTYTISGNAFLSRIEDQIHLTFTNFKVTNGPDLFVYAVKTESTENHNVKETVSRGEFINLGTLKGNIGNQSYVLSSDHNIQDYSVVSIWCRRFGRNFGSVHLTSSPDSTDYQ